MASRVWSVSRLHLTFRLESRIQRRSRRGMLAVLVAVNLLQYRPQSLHRGRKLGELIEVLDGEPGQSLGTVDR